MRSFPVKLGPLALLLTGIVLCLTALAILTLTAARADLAQAERYADTVRTRYALEQRGQAFLRDADEALRAGRSPDTLDAELTDTGVRKTFSHDGALLTVVLRTEDGSLTVEQWKRCREWAENVELGDLWPGS